MLPILYTVDQFANNRYFLSCSIRKIYSYLTYKENYLQYIKFYYLIFIYWCFFFFFLDSLDEDQRHDSVHHLQKKCIAKNSIPQNVSYMVIIHLASGPVTKYYSYCVKGQVHNMWTLQNLEYNILLINYINNDRTLYKSRLKQYWPILSSC